MTLRRLEMIEAMHRTNPVAQAAFKRGNAAGAHVKNVNKISRQQTRIQEQKAQRGDYSEEAD
jgi:hypothetical protein